jgi:hypothetical protein
MRRRGAGLNEDLEQPAIMRLLPGVADADVLDMSCSDACTARGASGVG